MSLGKVSRFWLLNAELNCTMQWCHPPFLGFIDLGADFLVKHLCQVIILYEREVDLEARHLGVAGGHVEDKISFHSRLSLVKQGETHLDRTKICVTRQLNKLGFLLNNHAVLHKSTPPPIPAHPHRVIHVFDPREDGRKGGQQPSHTKWPQSRQGEREPGCKAKYKTR